MGQDVWDMCNLKNARRSAQKRGRCIFGATFLAQKNLQDRDSNSCRFFRAEREVTIIIFVTLCLLVFCVSVSKSRSQVGYRWYDYTTSHPYDIYSVLNFDISYAPLAFKERLFQCKGAYTILNKQVIERQCVLLAKPIYRCDCKLSIYTFTSE